LIFNETKVIQARILMQKETGAKIEIFCLEPHSPTTEISSAFQLCNSVVWKCFIGNAKKWKTGKLFMDVKNADTPFILYAEKVGTVENAHLVELSWDPPQITFAEVLKYVGLVPLPPYLAREAVDDDKKNYQTIYAKYEGSVAAPTAGLHFTDQVFESLKKKNITFDFLSLHVGAGTFVPVSTENVAQHIMHTEKVIIKRESIQQLLNKEYEELVAVGTTTIRTLESLYWFGVKIIVDKTDDFQIHQWDPYQPVYNCRISVQDSMQAILNLMDKQEISTLSGATQLMIIPGYSFKIVNAIITNFHQPKSTLLLLIAAYLGDSWRAIYDYALANDFRFLSYGDSCLLFRVDK
ncbi:MAG: S-adenosylmethionine:tRNA ribosyltransferase-isomerase, partial [Bacteroidetes bacterium]|nr:S-adenosylmethionine:tRNA ribosyltransferase-isomerase [Bacteroidota bacterium]